MSIPPRILLLGAHPDDAEYHAGGLLTRYREELDATVRLISLTDGSAGHHERSPEELCKLRQEESANAGKVIGAEYLNWDLPDAKLEAPAAELVEHADSLNQAWRVVQRQTIDHGPKTQARCAFGDGSQKEKPGKKNPVAQKGRKSK